MTRPHCPLVRGPGPRARWLAALALLGGLGCQGGPRGGPPPAGPPVPPAEGTPPPAPDTIRLVTPPGQVATGLEAFISIGGVQGMPHGVVQAGLVNGYQRAGFRVHYVVAAMSFDPFAIKMAEVAAEYRAAGRNLRFVAFHHTGHGWDDHITYETPQGQRGRTTHNEIAVGLAVLFPRSEREFRATGFGLVYDACGQGSATNHAVRDRGGFVATATPNSAPRAQCVANNCRYICENCWTQTTPTYTYSTRYGERLLPASNDGQIDERAEIAHLAGQQAIRAAGAPSGCSGKFVRY